MGGFFPTWYRTPLSSQGAGRGLTPNDPAFLALVRALKLGAKNNLTGVGAPTTLDDRVKEYTPGSLWYDTIGDALYVCEDNTPGAAQWQGVLSTAVSFGAAGYPQDVAAVEADGSSNTVARADHVHAHGSGYLANAHHNAIHTHCNADQGGNSINAVSVRSINFALRESSELTIASGVINPTRAYHSVDTQSDASSDDLDTISFAGAVDGQLLLLRPESNSRTVVVKDATGNIQLANSQDFTMDDIEDMILLVYDSTVQGGAWLEIARSFSPAALTYAGTAQLADVAAAEAAGASTTVPRGDHVHAHGTGYLPDAHHTRSHNHSNASDGVALAPNSITSLIYTLTPAGSNPDALTIASGVVTATRSFHRIATEGGGGSDNLAGIAGGAVGQLLLIRPSADNNDVVVKHEGTEAGTATDRIHLTGHADFTMDDHDDYLLLVYDGQHSRWVEVCRSVQSAAPTYATTAELADVAAAEGAGSSATVPRGDHVHAHGSGYLPDAHHAQSHTLASHTTKNIDVLDDVDTATDPPATNEVLKWNGTNWVPAVYNYDFAFSIAAFTGSGVGGTSLIGAGTWKAIGAIQFDASYNNPPGGMTAWVVLSGASSPWSANLDMTGTPPTGPTTNLEAVTYPSGRTGTVTFTLNQSVDANTAADSHSFSNTMRYGTNGNGIGAQTEANVEALSEVPGPNESRSQTINNIPTDAGTYLTFAYADALSDVAQVQMDSGFGFVTASFAAVATTLAPTVQTAGLTTVQNSAGFVEAFAAITSRLTDLTNGTNDFKLLTTSTAQNYIYWGELAKASGYTESDVEGNYATQPGKVASNSMSSRSMTVNCGASEYTYIAYPARLGALTSILIGGFESISDFNVDNTALAVTNDAGYQEDYRVYVSKNPGFTNPTTMVVTI